MAKKMTMKPGMMGGMKGKGKPMPMPKGKKK